MMSAPDKQTLAVYAAQIDTYVNMVEGLDNPALARFIEAMPKGGRVLDLGCGPGQDAARMADAGLNVTAIDASPDMVALAARHPGVTAELAQFDALTDIGIYDGIWASFSLLHAPKSDFPHHIAAIKQALKPGGVAVLGLKTGIGESRDRLGRFYAYYEEDELRQILDAADLTVTDIVKGAAKGLAGDTAPFMIVTARA